MLWSGMQTSLCTLTLLDFLRDVAITLSIQKDYHIQQKRIRSSHGVKKIDRINAKIMEGSQPNSHKARFWKPACLCSSPSSPIPHCAFWRKFPASLSSIMCKIRAMRTSAQKKCVTLCANSNIIAHHYYLIIQDIG